jgi:hypothetical protein
VVERQQGIKLGAVRESGLTVCAPPPLVFSVAALEFSEPLFHPNPEDMENLRNIWNGYSSLVASRPRVLHGVCVDALEIPEKKHER